MKKSLRLFMIGFILLVSFSCNKVEAVDLSESSLANSLYVQDIPSGDTSREYLFSEDTLRICAVDNKADEETANNNENIIAAEYQNIQVIETEDSVTITGDHNFKIEFTKTSKDTLENEEGKVFKKISK